MDEEEDDRVDTSGSRGDGRCSGGSGSAALQILCGRTGLLCIMTAYTLLGALMFTALEGGDHNHYRHGSSGSSGHVQKSREECLKELWIITERLNVLYEKNWTKLVTEQLRRFERSVIESGQTDGGLLDGSGSDSRWSFGGALLYSVTLLTTVGYGHLSPRTSAGKAVAMIYAAIGVPLMLIMLSGFGTFLAGGAKRAYSKLCCLPQMEKAPPGGYERAPTSPGKHMCRNEDSSAIQLVPTYSSSNHHNHYNHLQNQSQHSSPVNHRLLDHGDGEIPPKKALLATVRASHSRGRCRQGLTHQMMIDQMTLQRCSDIEDAEDPDDNENECHNLHDTPSRIPLIWKGSSGMPHHSSVPGAPPLHSSSTTQTPQSPTPPSSGLPRPPVVPTSVILLFLAGYVCLGAAAFASTADWTFLDAAYFCFIALSTIGIIPSHGNPELSFGSQFQLVACCIYLVLGLVLVAMCFTLLQEEIAFKCRQFAESIGLVRH